MALLSNKLGTAARSKAKPLGVDFGEALLGSSTSSTGGSGSKKKKEDAAPAVKRPSYSNEKLLGDYTKLFYEQYQPEKMTYTQRTAEEIAGEIGAWLRPAYDAAIEARERRTDIDRAELDADAIARGMGTSSYVTDVKNRQLRQEASDIAALETDYAALLAKEMSDALAVERERAYETDLFNANTSREAYDKAYSMALSMLQAYRADERGARNLTDAMYA